jgi:DNA-binding Lrp family transcriptional regulator
MTPTRLSEQELRALGFSLFDADITVTEVARRAKISVSKLHYYLKKAFDRGMLKPQLLLDIYPLGLSYHGIFFSIESPQSTKRLIELCRLHPSAAFIQEYIGPFRLALGIIAASAHEALEIFSSIIQKSGVRVLKKAMTTRTALYEIPRRHMVSSLGDKPIQLFAATTKQVQLSEKEWLFLQSITRISIFSYREAARSVGIPHTTFVQRMAALKEKGIFLRRNYSFKSALLGVIPVKALIFCSGYDPKKRQALKQYLLDHKHAIHLVECFGAWDMEVNFEVWHTGEVQQFIDDLLNIFSGYITEITPMTLVEQHLRRFLPEKAPQVHF